MPGARSAVAVAQSPRTQVDDAARPLAGDERAARDAVAQCRDGPVPRDRATRRRRGRRRLAVLHLLLHHH